MIVMRYSGQALPLSSAQSLQELQKAAQASKAKLITVRLDGNNGYALALLGGGIPVAFTGLTENDLPEPAAVPAPVAIPPGPGNPLNTDRAW